MQTETSLGDTAEFLTKSQVADLLRVSRRTVDNMLARQQLPFYRINRRLLRFRREDIMEHLRRNFRVNGRECGLPPGHANP